MNATLLVMAGGASGAALRFHLGRIFIASLGISFPYGTLAANIIGGLAMGMVAGWLARFDGNAEHWRLFLAVGLLGGFTTFSAFSLEIANMIERGQWGVALGYCIISVIGAVLALFLGLFVIRQIA